MTVVELIEKLKEYDEDREVFDYCGYPIEKVTEEDGKLVVI